MPHFILHSSKPAASTSRRPTENKSMNLLYFNAEQEQSDAPSEEMVMGKVRRILKDKLHRWKKSEPARRALQKTGDIDSDEGPINSYIAQKFHPKKENSYITYRLLKWPKDKPKEIKTPAAKAKKKIRKTAMVDYEFNMGIEKKRILDEIRRSHN